ncbi:MAG: hypothetical protein K9H84_00460 [Bacteroidales bacterium]|nr:hypothetical protein [Bacteroidales bacterium]
MNKYSFPNVLVIGANHRKAGKSKLIESIVRHFRHDGIVAVKIAAYDKLEDFKQHYPGYGEMILIDEKEGADRKDSKRFLKAGASKSFFIAGMERPLMNRIPELLDEYKSRPVVVESNWFALKYEPGYLLLLEDKNVKRYKHSFQELIKHADSVIPPDTITDLTLNYWRFEGNIWKIGI